MCIDDWFINHSRWSKRCSPKEGQRLKKKGKQFRSWAYIFLSIPWFIFHDFLCYYTIKKFVIAHLWYCLYLNGPLWNSQTFSMKNLPSNLLLRYPTFADKIAKGILSLIFSILISSPSLNSLLLDVKAN